MYQCLHDCIYSLNVVPSRFSSFLIFGLQTNIFYLDTTYLLVSLWTIKMIHMYSHLEYTCSSWWIKTDLIQIMVKSYNWWHTLRFLQVISMYEANRKQMVKSMLLLLLPNLSCLLHLYFKMSFLPLVPEETLHYVHLSKFSQLTGKQIGHWLMHLCPSKF